MYKTVIAMFTFLYWWFRPIMKWFLRKTTRLCELQRICYGVKEGARRTFDIEFSITHSRSREIINMYQRLDKLCSDRKFTGNNELFVKEAVNVILRVKKINSKIHKQFPISISKCIKHIWGYRELINEVEYLKMTVYDCNDAHHEKKLLDLWDALKPDEKLQTRITKQWQDIGFQGDDPRTDFRGMGLLGLENLLYFAQEYQDAARHVLSHSYHPKSGYAFAIVGINLTYMAYLLLKDNSARTHIYNISSGCPTLRSFHLLYCYLFYEFDKFWIKSKPKDVMSFSFIRENFETNIRTALANPDTIFRSNFSIDNI